MVRRRIMASGRALAALVCVSGCGSAGHPAAVRPVSPAALLRRSRSVLNATPAVHFTLTSAGVTGSGTTLTGGSGDLVRPGDLTGSLLVSANGLHASVGVVEADGRFYAEPPFFSRYTVTDPASYGLGDPAELLSPTKGVSSLLTSMTGVHAEGRQRIAGELVTVISGTVPGQEVPVLPDQARAVAVRLTVSIDPATAQLRRVALAGPFTSATATTTYTVTLTKYGEHVKVTAPAT